MRKRLSTYILAFLLFACLLCVHFFSGTIENKADGRPADLNADESLAESANPAYNSSGADSKKIEVSQASESSETLSGSRLASSQEAASFGPDASSRHPETSQPAVSTSVASAQTAVSTQPVASAYPVDSLNKAASAQSDAKAVSEMTINPEPAENAPADAERAAGNDYNANSAEPVKNDGISSPILPEVPDAVAEKANALAGSEVDTKDFITVGTILLKKLSIKEIKYLFDAAQEDLWVNLSLEEIESIRNILFTKLSDEEIRTLRELGKKYGRSMAIIDPDLDVAKTKAEQEAIAKQKSGKE